MGISGGCEIGKVRKNPEYYTWTGMFENTGGKQAGKVSIRSPTSGAFDAIISDILANSAITSSR